MYVCVYYIYNMHQDFSFIRNGGMYNDISLREIGGRGREGAGERVTCIYSQMMVHYEEVATVCTLAGVSGGPLAPGVPTLAHQGIPVNPHRFLCGKH